MFTIGKMQQMVKQTPSKISFDLVSSTNEKGLFENNKIAKPKKGINKGKKSTESIFAKIFILSRWQRSGVFVTIGFPRTFLVIVK